MMHVMLHGELGPAQLKDLKLDEELTHPEGGSFSSLPRGPVVIDLLLLLPSKTSS